MPFGELTWDGANRSRINDDMGKVDPFCPEVFRQCIPQRCIGDKAKSDELLAEGKVAANLFLQGNSQLVFRNDTAFDQNPPDGLAGRWFGFRRVHAAGYSARRVVELLEARLCLDLIKSGAARARQFERFGVEVAS